MIHLHVAEYPEQSPHDGLYRLFKVLAVLGPIVIGKELGVIEICLDPHHEIVNVVVGRNVDGRPDGFPVGPEKFVLASDGHLVAVASITAQPAIIVICLVVVDENIGL